MKKIFTMMAAFAVAVAAQAGLKFKVGGQIIENGGTGIAATITDESYPDYGIYIYKINAEAYLLTDEDELVDLKVEFLEGEESSVQVCSFGNCVPWANHTVDFYGKTVPFSAETNEYATNLEIHSEYYETGKILTNKLRLTACYTEDPEQSVSITLVMTSDPALTAIDGVEAGQSEMRFDGRNFQFRFEGNASRTIDLFNAAGQLVHSAAIDSNEGHVSLATLRPGAYLYRVRGDKKPMTGKVMVR